MSDVTMSDVTALRRRADDLRALADRIETSPALVLQRWADIGTWRGPRALGAVSRFEHARRSLCLAIDELRRRSFALDRRADELAVAATATVAPPAAGTIGRW